MHPKGNTSSQTTNLPTETPTQTGQSLKTGTIYFKNRFQQNSFSTPKSRNRLHIGAAYPSFVPNPPLNLSSCPKDSLKSHRSYIGMFNLAKGDFKGDTDLPDDPRGRKGERSIKPQVDRKLCTKRNLLTQVPSQPNDFELKIENSNFNELGFSNYRNEFDMESEGAFSRLCEDFRDIPDKGFGFKDYSEAVIRLLEYQRYNQN